MVVLVAVVKNGNVLLTLWGKSMMKKLIIDISDDLHKEIKHNAIDLDVTIKHYVITVLEDEYQFNNTSLTKSEDR